MNEGGRLGRGVGRRHLIVGAMLLSAVLSGCGSGAGPTVAVQSPVDTVYAWFAAINADDVPLIQAHFANPDLARSWARGAPHGNFPNVRCRLTSQASTTAVVNCTFEVRETWGGMMAGGSGWGVYLERQPPGPWLINNYGQG